MNQQDELFLLIKSMNKNEKGYFRKFSGIHSNKGEGDYMKLFDCMCAMKEYDDAAISQQFKDQKMLNHLRATKHYLKNLIIRALRNYQEDQVPYISDKMALADSFIMLNRGLYKSAAKRILKEKQAAAVADKFIPALEWITLYDTLLVTSGKVAELQQTSQQVLMEREKLTGQYMNLNGYVFLRNILLSITVNKTSKEELKKLDPVLKHPLLSSNKMPLSNRAREYYTEILVRIYSLKNEQKKAIPVLNEMIAWCENLQNTNPPQPDNYFVLLNLLLNCMEREDVLAIPAIIDKCRKLISGNNTAISLTTANAMQGLIYIHEMRMYIMLRKPHAVLNTSHKLEEHYKKWPPKKDAEIDLWLFRAIAYLELKQFDKALAQLNRIFNYDITEQNYQLYDANLLNIIIHLELGNYTILKRQLDIARNHVTKNLSHPDDYLWIFKEFTLLAKTMQAADKKAISLKAGNFLKKLRLKKIPPKEYMEDWLTGKL